MAQLLTNTFAVYDLTEEEALQGSILTIQQVQVIQNLLAGAAEEKLNLELDPLNPVKFAQEEASLKGQIDILRYLLDTSIESNSTLNNPNHSTEV